MIGKLEDMLVSVKRQVLENYLAIEREGRMRQYLEHDQDRMNASIVARLELIEERLGVEQP